MIRLGIVALALASLAGTAAARQQATEEISPEEALAKQSYALGVTLGNQLRENSVQVDMDSFTRGMREALAGQAGQMGQEEFDATIGEIREDRERKVAARRSELVLKNQMAGQVLLVENRGKNGVVALESGLQYEILKTGEGKIPAYEDTVVCHYRGTLVDGREFDNSYKRGKPTTFQVSRVIKGWSEALQRMPVGSKWRLYIPSDLAYGELGVGTRIEPGMTLIFEVELLAIKDEKSKATGTAAAMRQPSARPEPASGLESKATPRAPGPALELSFKLDSRLSGGTYGGDKWVSPQVFVGASAQQSVDVRAVGRDARGRTVAVRARWLPSDSGMISVSPAEGDAVTITVKSAGQSRLSVVVGELRKELMIQAEYKGKEIQVSIDQRAESP